MHELLKEIKSIKTDHKSLQSFGWIVGGIILAIAGLLLWKGEPNGGIWVLIGAGLVVAGSFAPKSLKSIYMIWMSVGLLLGSIIAPIILAILYYAGFTSIALIARIQGKKFMDLDFHKTADSYWTPKLKKEDNRKSCETQY